MLICTNILHWLFVFTQIFAIAKTVPTIDLFPCLLHLLLIILPQWKVREYDMWKVWKTKAGGLYEL